MTEEPAQLRPLIPGEQSSHGLSQALGGAALIRHHPLNFEKNTAAHARVSRFCTTLYFPKFSANFSYREGRWKAPNI